jgi:hypothetical protein
MTPTGQRIVLRTKGQPSPSTADQQALRGNALRFRNLTHYRLRSLLDSGALHALINALWITKSHLTARIGRASAIQLLPETASFVPRRGKPSMMSG